MKSWAMLSVATCVLALALTAHAKSNRSLGQLAQAIEPTTIHAQPSATSRVLYSEQRFNYMIIRPGPSKTWSKVIMSDMSTAYIRSSHIAPLPYEVMSDVAFAHNGGPSSELQQQLASFALNYRGTRYVWGGTSLSNGVDCSGFVKRMFGRIGENLPRTAAEQARVGDRVHRLEELRAGDRLYFWSAKRNKIGHTGIYLGNGYFVHASYSKGQVTTDYLGNPYWLKTLVAARR